MRHVSDLPRNLHIVSSRREGEEIYDVQLAMPGEAQVGTNFLNFKMWPKFLGSQLHPVFSW